MKQKIIDRFFNKVIPEPNSGCWLWISTWDDKHYGNFWAEGHMLKAHRVSWVIHNGNIPNGLCVLHRCDTPPCVNPRHLFLGTKADNNHDMIRKGRANFCGTILESGCKLTEAQVMAIKLQLSFGHTLKTIAQKYEVSTVAIHKIKTGKTWKHLS